MATFRLDARGPFSLAASTRFLEGFAPAGLGKQEPGRLRLAFCLEQSWQPVLIDVQAAANGVTVQADSDSDEIRQNVARILSLDVDGGDFPVVGQRDPIARALQRRYPGLRPVGFWSAYEAACWAVISQRIQIFQGARLKARLSAEHGHELDGERAFPSPERLLSANIDFLPSIKVERLHNVARAALDGLIVSRTLRDAQPEDALEKLRALPGIGPFSAELILVRGAMAPDVFPTAERRLHDSMRSAYQCPQAGPAELAEIAEAWRPYRTWVALLFRTARQDDLHDIRTA